MQIIFLPVGWTLALFIVLWAALQLSTALLCLRVSDNRLRWDRGLYRTRAWEREGRAYARLGIRRWKAWLPDGGAVTRGGYRKKHLGDISPAALRRFLVESCRAELSHWLAVLPFWVFGLFAPWPVVPIMLGYALAVNLPCILAQRYNRPRIAALLRRLDRCPVSSKTPPNGP